MLGASVGTPVVAPGAGAEADPCADMVCERGSLEDKSENNRDQNGEFLTYFCWYSLLYILCTVPLLIIM